MFNTVDTAAALAATIRQAVTRARDIHPDDPAAPEPVEGNVFPGTLGDIPVLVVYTETCAGVIVDGVSIGGEYAEASCFASGQLSVWRDAIESRLQRLAEGAVFA